MNKFLQAFVVFLLWSFIALLFHFYVSDTILGKCSFEHLQSTLNTSEEINPKIKQEKEIDLFIISDDKGKQLLKFKGKFEIKSKTETVYIPSQLEVLKDSVKNFLSKNPSYHTFIVANYLISEINDVNGENLGLKRAQFLKNWMIQSGVSADRIKTEAQLAEFNFDNANSYDNAISIYFKDMVSLNASVATDIVTNKTLRFSFGNQSFRATPELIDYVLELKSYLSQYPNKKIYIIGHTDSEGDDTYNYNIGLQRAQFVKDFLISQQIENYKIVSSSKGELEPIADNLTREGKSLNRRIEIIVK
jgi:outer membrane protein OmpA-like peptidoglycan-associated protein